MKYLASVVLACLPILDLPFDSLHHPNRLCSAPSPAKSQTQPAAAVVVSQAKRERWTWFGREAKMVCSLQTSRKIMAQRSATSKELLHHTVILHVHWDNVTYGKHPPKAVSFRRMHRRECRLSLESSVSRPAYVGRPNLCSCACRHIVSQFHQVQPWMFRLNVLFFLFVKLDETA